MAHWRVAVSITRRQATVGGVSLLANTALNTASRVQTATEGIIKLSDASIEYFSQGEGEAVVLLPGGSLTVGYMEGGRFALTSEARGRVQGRERVSLFTHWRRTSPA
jgi:hypothetical protein